MSAWANYGFPDPRLLTSCLPMEGLFKALAERYLPFVSDFSINVFFMNGADTTIGDILQYDFIDTLGRINTRLNNLGYQGEPIGHLDVYIRNICYRYLNHRGGVEANWTWQDLCACAAPEGLIEPEMLAPVLLAEYTVQRYRMINLLRFPVFDSSITVDVFSGSTHNGVYHDMASSLDFAFNDNSYKGTKFFGTGIGNMPIIENYVEGIYGPDHGWAEGTYCCNFVENANVSLESALRSGPMARMNVASDELVLYLNVTAPGGDDANFDDMGFDGVSLGTNIIRPQDGILLKRTLPYIQSTPPTPVAGRFTYRGWNGRLLLTCDLAPHFLFYDNVEGE